MKISKERLKQLVQEELAIGVNVPAEDEMVDGERPRDPDGYEGSMAKQNLWRMAEYAKALYNIIEDDQNLEPWVQEKIAVASFMMDSVGHYMEYQNHTAEADAVMGKDDLPHDDEGAVGIEVTGTGVAPEEEEEYEFDVEPEEYEDEDEEGDEDEDEREEL